MAVVKDNIFVAPSTDVRTLEQLDSTVIEAGIYHCIEEKTILNTTSDKWTVICLSNETQASLRCFSQIWLPAESNLLEHNRRMYIRTAGTTSDTYSPFSTYVASATDEVVDMYFGGEEPDAEPGITKIWYNTDN